MEHASKIILRKGSVILQEEFQDIIDQLSSNPLFRRYYESKNPPPGGPRTQRSHSVADISSFTPTLQQHIQQSIHMLQTRHNPHNPPLNNSSNPSMKRPREEEEEQYPYKRTDNGPTSSSNNKNINSNNNNNNNNSETEYVRRRGSMSWEPPPEPSSYPSKPPSYPPHQSHSNSSSRPSHPHSSPHLHSEPHYSQSPYPSDPSYPPSEPYYPHHHSYYSYPPPHYPPSHHPQGSYHHPPYSHTPPPYAYPHHPPSPGDLHPNNTYDADHPSPSSPLTNGPTQHKPPYRPPYPSKPYSPHSATPPTPVNGGGYSTPSPGQYYTPPSSLPPPYKSNPLSYNSPNRGAKSANGVSSESDHYPSESYSPAPLPSPSLPPPYSSSLPYDEPSNPQTKPDLNASSDSLVNPFPFPLSPSDPSSHPFLHNSSDSHYRNRLSRSTQTSGHHPHPPPSLSRSGNQLSNPQSKRVGHSDPPSNSHHNPPFKADHSNSHSPSHSSEKIPFDEPFDLVSSYSEAPPVNFYPTDHTRSSVGDIEDRGREEEARHDNGKGKDEKREDERPSAPLSLSAGSSDSFGLSSSTNSMILSLINEGLSDPDPQSDPPPDSDSSHPLSHSFTDLPNNNPAENSSDSSFSLENFTDPYYLYATKVISQRLSKLPPPSSFPIPTTKNHPSDNSHFSAPHHPPPPHYPPPFHPHNNNGNNNNNNNINNNYSRRHSISHIPLNGEITNEDLKVTKWTNVTTTIAKKYAKGGDPSDPNKSNEPYSSAPSSTPGDVKLLMSKWKCTKYRVD